MNGIRFGREIRWLFQTALLMFLITIGLGWRAASVSSTSRTETNR